MGHGMELAHLTVNTNHLRMSPRKEVSSEAILVCSSFVQQGRHDIPGLPGVWCETRRKNVGRASLTIGGRHGAVIAALLAWEAEAAARAWPAIIALARHGGVIAPEVRMPKTLPWLAVSLAPIAMVLTRDELMALADFERCWAWAVLESQG